MSEHHTKCLPVPPKLDQYRLAGLYGSKSVGNRVVVGLGCPGRIDRHLDRPMSAWVALFDDIVAQHQVQREGSLDQISHQELPPTLRRSPDVASLDAPPG